MGSIQRETQEHLETLVGLVRGYRDCMLTTHSRDGQLRSRPMAIAQVEDNGDIWLPTSIDSPKVAEIEKDPHVNIGFMQSSDSYLSIAGHAQVVRDRNKALGIWNERWGLYFPQGKDTPDLALIRVRGEHGEYWNYSGAVSKMQYYFEAGKSYIQGKRPDLTNVGENAKVEIK